MTPPWRLPVSEAIGTAYDPLGLGESLEPFKLIGLLEENKLDLFQSSFSLVALHPSVCCGSDEPELAGVGGWGRKEVPDRPDRPGDVVLCWPVTLGCSCHTCRPASAAHEGNVSEVRRDA